MKNKSINFKYLVGQVMIDRYYLTTKKLGRIIIIEKNNHFIDLQQVCSPQVRGLTGSLTGTEKVTLLFPASTGINRISQFINTLVLTVPRKYGD